MTRFFAGGVLLLMLWGMTGCTTTSMKGTPFYHGDYAESVGDSEDRVNLWPLLYYRKPALSLLWPIFEYSDEHVAARPLISYYGRGSDARELNLLWPLGKFKLDQNEHRFFPFFWGDDYTVGFPLYYRFDDPFGGHGSSTLFPLWSYSNKSSGHSLHLLWPFLHHSNRPRREGWRVWPLAGSYNHYGNRRSYAAWPLAQRWKDKPGTTTGDTVLPFYWREKGPDQQRFYSFPYSAGSEADGDHWRVVPPLWYDYQRDGRREWGSLLGGRRTTATETNTFVLPALSWSSTTAVGRETRLLLGLGGTSHQAGVDSSHLFPLYRHERSEESSLFLSLPYSRRIDSDGGSWRLVPPLWYSQREPDGDSMRLTLLYGDRKRPDGSYAWRALMPLVYSREDPDDQLVATLLGGYRTRAERLDWLALPLLARGEHTPDASRLWYLAGLGYLSWGGRGGWTAMAISLLL